MARRLDNRCATGGILRLRELISEHPAELAYDFRTRFNLSIYDIGESVSWSEAILLISVLMRDTDSWLQSAVSGWKFPVSRQWIVTAHLWDLLANINSKKKPKPYPTPWPDADTKKIGGTTKPQQSSKVRALLERMNPKED